MNGLQIFENAEIGKVRTVLKDNEVWFVAKDVSDILQYTDTQAMTRRLDDDETQKIEADNLSGANSMARQITIINESGLYNAIIGSKKPQAKKFKKWITSEVLPAIRKTGSYSNNAPKTYIEAMKEAIRIEEKRLLLEKQNKELLPKAEFFDAITQSDSTIDMSEVAKILNIGIGRNQLYKFLREKKILDSNNNPYQKFVDRKYFKIVESKYRRVGLKTVVYQKGLDFIRKKTKDIDFEDAMWLAL